MRIEPSHKCATHIDNCSAKKIRCLRHPLIFVKLHCDLILRTLSTHVALAASFLFSDLLVYLTFRTNLPFFEGSLTVQFEQQREHFLSRRVGPSITVFLLACSVSLICFVFLNLIDELAFRCYM